MPLDVESAIRAAVDRCRTNAALAFMGAFVLLNVPAVAVPAVADFSRLDPLLRRPDVIVQRPAVVVAALALVIVGLAVLAVVLALGLVVALAALRTFAADEDRRIHRETIAHEPLAYLHFVVGAVVYALAVSVGLALFVVPGVFLAVSLGLWPAVVAAEDEGFVGAFRRSWELTAGHRWSVFALGFATLAIAALVTGLFSWLGVAGAFGEFAARAGGAVATVFVGATLVEGYRALVDREPVDPHSSDAEGGIGEGSVAGEGSAAGETGSTDPE